MYDLKDCLATVEKQTRKTTKEAGIAGVQLDADANDLIQAWCDKHDKIKRGVLSKLSRWWLKQPLFLQQITLSEVDPELQLAYAEQLEALAGKLRESATSGAATSDQARPDKPDSPHNSRSRFDVEESTGGELLPGASEVTPIRERPESGGASSRKSKRR